MRRALSFLALNLSLAIVASCGDGDGDGGARDEPRLDGVSVSEFARAHAEDRDPWGGAESFWAAAPSRRLSTADASDAQPFFDALLSSSDPVARALGLWGVLEVGSHGTTIARDDWIRTVVSALDDPSASVRFVSAYALAREAAVFGPRAGVEPVALGDVLIHSLDAADASWVVPAEEGMDPPTAVRWCVVGAIGDLFPSAGNSRMADRLAALLVEESARSYLTWKAAEILASWREPRVLEWARGRLADGGEWERGRVAGIVESMGPAAQGLRDALMRALAAAEEPHGALRIARALVKGGADPAAVFAAFGAVHAPEPEDTLVDWLVEDLLEAVRSSPHGRDALRGAPAWILDAERKSGR